jgi:hypothetical protein
MCAVVNSHKEDTFFWEFNPYQYSTCSRETAESLMREPHIEFVSKERVASIVLKDLNLVINPSDPTFLTIDIEGLDFEILSSVDWSKVSPRVICVEDFSIVRPSRIETLLTEKGYNLVDKGLLSSIYVHKSYPL